MHREPDRPPNLTGGKPADSGDFLLERRLRVCRPYLAGDRQTLLDFGCGNGAQTLRFVDEFASIRGVDVDASFLAAFAAEIERRGLSDRVEAVRYPGREVPLPDACTGQVISFAVLEHVPDQELALREMHRLLRPGGRLIISVPNKWWIFETHGANLPLLPWNRVPLVSWWPKILHQRYARARIYRAREIVRLVEAAGFRVDAVLRMTAPLDVLKWRPLQDLMRRTIFKADTTGLPVLATEVFVVADRPH